MFTGVGSIFGLAAISLERMYAIGWPFRHRTLKFRVYIFAVVMQWILAAIFTSIALLTSLSVLTWENFAYIQTLFLGTPLLVICIAYFVVWKKQNSMVDIQNHVVRETRLAKTLFIITAASLLIWLPFQILLVLLNFTQIRNQPHFNTTFFVIKLLQFSNSLVNVIIYPFRISEFKKALLQMNVDECRCNKGDFFRCFVVVRMCVLVVEERKLCRCNKGDWVSFIIFKIYTFPIISEY